MQSECYLRGPIDRYLDACEWFKLKEMYEKRKMYEIYYEIEIKSNFYV